MVRALILAAFICACSVFCGVDARWTTRPKYTTTTTPLPTTLQTTTPRTTTPRPTTTRRTTVPSTLPPTTTKRPTVVPSQLPVGVAAAVPKPLDDDRFYHPAEGKHPRLVEQQDQRFLDGHYEYRYVLSNGDTRYERSYWQRVGDKKMLLRKGFYSYPLPNNNYLTVFYSADGTGFHQDLSTYSPERPVLPRSLVVPESDPPTMNEIIEHNKQNPGKIQWNQSTKPATIRPKVRTVAIDSNANDVADASSTATQHAQDEVVVPQQQIPTATELRKIMAQLDAEILTASRPTTAKHEQPQDADNETETENVNKVEVAM